jgi:spore coat protein U-like protein
MFDTRLSVLLAFTLLAAISTPQAQAKTCAVSGAGVSFGPFDPTSPANLDTIGYVTVDCNGSIDAKLSLTVGNGVGASYSAGRKMTQGAGGTLFYQLYANAARTLVLGDGTGGSVTLEISEVHSASQAIWARIPVGQGKVAPGNYSDTVIATIRY